MEKMACIEEGSMKLKRGGEERRGERRGRDAFIKQKENKKEEKGHKRGEGRK